MKTCNLTIIQLICNTNICLELCLAISVYSSGPGAAGNLYESPSSCILNVLLCCSSEPNISRVLQLELLMKAAEIEEPPGMFWCYVKT